MSADADFISYEHIQYTLPTYSSLIIVPADQSWRDAQSESGAPLITNFSRSSMISSWSSAELAVCVRTARLS